MYLYGASFNTIKKIQKQNYYSGINPAEFKDKFYELHVKQEGR